MGGEALDRHAHWQVTARRAVSVRRASSSFSGRCTVLSTRRVPAAFEARDPGSSPRVSAIFLKGPSSQRIMPQGVAASTRADAPAAQTKDAPKRKREPNARVVRPPRRPACHSRPRARAAHRPAAPLDRPAHPLESAVSAVARVGVRVFAKKNRGFPKF